MDVAVCGSLEEAISALSPQLRHPSTAPSAATRLLERLRLGLALTLGRARPPQLVLLDEPTNHLDLAAIAAVERALGEYDGALIFVTHDSAFAAALAPAREIAIASGRVSDRGLA